ncbi:MAG: hypothetical protein CMB65_03040 [Euryarchaeota archaeon]|nr:hypothetical protein [Euryarchaeota archaeon]
MDNENGTVSTKAPFFGLLAIPATIAIMLAMMVAATWNTVDYEASDWNKLLMMTTVLMAGGLLGKAPRIIFEPVGTRPSLVSLGFAVVIGAVGMIHYYDGAALLGLAFTMMAIGVHLYDRSRRHEEEVIVVGIVAGFLYAIQVASAGHEFTGDATLASSGYYDLLDVDRAVTGYLFFTWWIISILSSVLIALALRGRLQEGGKGSWFNQLPETLGKDHTPLYVGLGVWLVAHIVSMWHLKSLDNADAIFLTQHAGFFWALFTGLIAMFVAFCWAEHWRTLGLLISLNWVLYSIGTWQSKAMFGLDEIGFLNGDLGGLSWFLIFFWTNALFIYLGFAGRLLSGPERRGHGQARLWWGQHWYAITICSALLTAFAVRVMWNVIPAMNAAGTGEWDMTGGSDPWYMKRAIDYILAQNSHFVIDMDRAYPVGSINPRPPLFSWSLALGGVALDPFLDGDVHDAAWWSIAGMPAVFGALTVLPIAATCKRFFGTGAGAIGAWLMALMPGHVSHSTFALADHDAFVILFMSLGFYFWLCAVDSIGNDKLLEDSNWNPLHLVKGIRAAFKQHPVAMAQAILAGVSFATVALGWKGFVYGLAIVYAAFFMQTAINLVRRRDSMPVTAAIIVMMLTTFILPLPFYGNLQLNLIWDASGFQPLFYIVGFTVINGWIVTAFRDKPWLMVIIMGAGISTILLGTLYILQLLEISNGWDVLTTGGFYFTKNKVFGTIAEAQAPSRGQLFANFGPLVFIFSLGMGLASLLRGFKNRDPKNPSRLMGPASLVLAVWILLASYMAWSAGRFMFNATPVMAIMGSAGVVGLWRSSGVREYVKTWRRMGVTSPRARLSSTIRAGRKHLGVPAIGMILILLFSQHAIYGLDSGIPRGENGEKQVDDVIYGLVPDVLRADLFGWSVLDGSPYSDYGVGDENMTACRGECWYMGTFGPGFNGAGWNQAYDWLESQDSEVTFSERPAFVSWWDYGFQALAQGQHPTVADNFQSGIPAAGNMLLANGEEDTIALFIITLAEGDMRHEFTLDKGTEDDEQFTRAFANAMQSHLNAATDGDVAWDEWVTINTMSNSQDVRERSFTIIGTSDDTMLAEGSMLNDDGTRSTDLIYRVYENRELVDEFTDKESAITMFDSKNGNTASDWVENCPANGETSIDTRSSGGDELYPGDAEFTESNAFSCSASHYIIGDYWYTSDLYDDFDDVSTSLHRQNARYAIARDLLTQVFSLDELVDLYNDLTSIEYEVATYEGAPGETIVRNNDIRYFAVDNRLYPVGGYQYAENGMHYGNPTGIFYAPTTLSGLDPDNYITSEYITSEGPMTAAEFEDRYLAQLLASQSGGDSDIIELEDVLVEHSPDFFDTMIARTYVGYGTPTLGIDNVERIGQPRQHFSQYSYGTPDSLLTYAYPLPGAMMSHFVVANWYDPAQDNASRHWEANTGVKVLKYYSGATLEGDVVLGELGAVPNAKILIERDAFSGEDPSDTDARNYWIPIASAQADDNGHFSVTVPSGKIRVSAFMGDSDLTAARDLLVTTPAEDQVNWVYDLWTETNADRTVNPITGILGNVSGSTWLGESVINVTGDDGHSNGEVVLTLDVQVQASGATGIIEWSGESDFGGEPLANMDLRISNIWDETRQDEYYITTSDGETEGEREYGPGATGEVTFTGDGTMISEEGVVTATDFTGNYTRSIQNNHSYTGTGNILGIGTFVGTIEDSNGLACDANGAMPDNSSYCLEDANVTDTYLIDGLVENVTGRFTSKGTSFFTTQMYRETIIGSGTFVVDTSDETLTSYGTINGTGTFQGTGQFSGDMVKAGSFHLVDAIPGTYHVSVLFENGQEATLPVPLEVPLSRNSPEAKNIQLSLPGTWIQGTASTLAMDTEESQAVTGRLELVNATEMDAEVSEPCGDVAWSPCWFETDENGTFGIGPVLQGDYVVTMDQDDDGFDEYRSETITVLADTAGNVTPTNIERIPPMFDIEFLLLDHEDQPVEGQNLTFSNQFTPFTVDARDNGNGSYNIELPQDTWVVESILNDDYILYEEIELEDSITDLVLQYTESAWVNGTVMYDTSDKPDEESQPYVNQVVFARWGGISESALTDQNGTFGMQIPVGAEINLTAYVVVGSLLAGENFVVPSGGITVDLQPQNSVGAAGDLFLYEIGTPYTQNVPGFGDHPFMLEAYDSVTGVTWQWPVETAQGRFTAYVLEAEEDNESRNWTLSINNAALNVEPVTYSPLGDNNTLMLIAEPDHVMATIHTFIDHDGNMSNGTALPVDFRMVPSNAFEESMIINISADDARWQNGSIELELRVGNWYFETDTKDPRDENATDYNTLLSNSTGAVEVALGSDSFDVEMGFMPEWLTSIELRNESAGVMANWTVHFEEIDGDESFDLDTDANGTIVEYLPEGEWLAFVDEFIIDDGDDTNDDPLQLFRGTVTVDSNTPGTTTEWQAIEAAQFNLTLIEQGSDELLSGFTITAMSDDGLGEFTLGPSDDDGVIDASLMEGNWTLSLNRTDINVRWVLENFSISIESGSGNDDLNLTLNKWVEIAGNLFRDLDGNGMWSGDESIADADVVVSSESFGPVNLTSNVFGTWRTFVPVNATYDISASKAGYSEGMGTMDVGFTVNTTDIEMVAGIVSVSGEISHVLPSEWNLISDEIVLELIPESGMEYGAVTPVKVLDNGVWNGTWNADVEPGNWILYASYNGNEGQFAAMTLLQAAVAEGGEADAMLSSASILHVSTKWNDYDGTERTLADDSLIISGGHLVFVGTEVTSWNQTVDSEGKVTLLLPAGDFSMSGTFVTSEQGVNMTYNGGKSAEVVGGGVESPEQVVLFSVEEDHSVSFVISDDNETHIGITQSETDSDHFTIIDNGDTGDDGVAVYEVAEVNLEVVYNGNRAQDEYLLKAQMNGADASYWDVSFWVGSGNTTDTFCEGAEEFTDNPDANSNQNNSEYNPGEDYVDANFNGQWDAGILDNCWAADKRITLGLESGVSENVTMRIQAANKSHAVSMGGHSLLLQMQEEITQVYDEYELKIFVPQEFGIEIDQSEIADVIGVQIGQQETYSFVFENTGNGDDTYMVEISDLPTNMAVLWSVTGPSSIPDLGPRTLQQYSVTINANELWEGDAEFQVLVTITSEDGNTSETVTLNIKTALPILAIESHETRGLSMDGFAPMNQKVEIFAQVENTGDVDARDVEVIVLNENDTVVGSLMLDIPKGEMTNYSIFIDEVNELGSITYTLKINVTADEVDVMPEEELVKINYQPPVATESNNWVALIVFAFVIGIIWLFWKFSGRRGGQAF